MKDIQTKHISNDVNYKMEGDKMTVSGYASVFGNVDSYGDIVVKGAFAKTISENRERKVKFLWQHKMDTPIGVITRLEEDEKGLLFEAEFADIQQAIEARNLLKIGAIDGVSFGYSVIQSEVDGENLLLKEIRLYEISIVTNEANSKAKVTDVKSVDPEERAIDTLVGLGYSYDEAEGSVKKLSLGVNQADDVSRDELLHSLKQFKQQLIKGN